MPVSVLLNQRLASSTTRSLYHLAGRACQGSLDRLVELALADAECLGVLADRAEAQIVGVHQHGETAHERLMRANAAGWLVLGTQAAQPREQDQQAGPHHVREAGLAIPRFPLHLVEQRQQAVMLVRWR